MSEIAAGVEDATPEAATQSQTRTRSTIKFPYTDIKDAQQVARAVKDKFGSSCTVDQLAAALGQKSTSGAFRVKLATAVTFGVIVHTRGSIDLTASGHAVADDSDGALVDAFMHVPLYRAIYEKFQGTSLPSDAGLEAEMRSLGVAEKQADKARQAFYRSAERANLFWSGRERLVVPPVVGGPIAATGPSAPAVKSEEESPQSLAEDPILQGIFRRLPKEGPFPKKERDLWFAALRMNIELIYGPVSDHEGQAME